MTPDIELKAKWWAWHKANPDVWRLFERFTFEAVERGASRLSGWLIINRIRWETNVVTGGGDFKISNDFVALYVRLWRVKHPQHAELFEVKPAKRLGETRKAAA